MINPVRIGTPPTQPKQPHRQAQRPAPAPVAAPRAAHAAQPGPRLLDKLKEAGSWVKKRLEQREAARKAPAAKTVYDQVKANNQAWEAFRAQRANAKYLADQFEARRTLEAVRLEDPRLKVVRQP